MWYTHTWPTPLLNEIPNRQLSPVFLLSSPPNNSFFFLSKRVSCYLKLSKWQLKYAFIKCLVSRLSALSHCAFIKRLLEICICSFLTSYQAIWPFTAIHNNNLILHTSTITARGEERTALSSKRRYPSLLLSAADIVARMIFFSWSASLLRRACLKEIPAHSPAD